MLLARHRGHIEATDESSREGSLFCRLSGACHRWRQEGEEEAGDWAREGGGREAQTLPLNSGGATGQGASLTAGMAGDCH